MGTASKVTTQCLSHQAVLKRWVLVGEEAGFGIRYREDEGWEVADDTL